jgi:CBS domain-containing protein
VRDIMSRDVISVSEDSLLVDAFSLFRDKRISILIVKRGDELVGLLTERDAVYFIHKNLKADQVLVADVATTSVVTVNEETSLFGAYSVLMENNFRHLVITDDDGQLAGVATLSDMLDGMGVEYFVDLKQVVSVMTKAAVRVRPDDSLRLVIDLMYRHCVTCVVVAEQWNPVGIITERDIVKYYELGAEAESVKASYVMNSPVQTMPESAYIPEVNKTMIEHGIRHMIIVDGRGQLTGLISQADLARCIESGHIFYLTEVTKALEKEVTKRTQELAAKNKALQEALLELKTLKGVIPICSFCYRIRDDDGAWSQMEKYISERSSAQFSHGVCPVCLPKYSATMDLSITASDS